MIEHPDHWSLDARRRERVLIAALIALCLFVGLIGALATGKLL